MRFVTGLVFPVFIFATVFARGQVIISDNYNVVGSGTGFAIGAGVNTGINPPTTRLSGTAASNLRYIPTANKTNTAFGIAGNKLQVTSAANPGRFTLSANGTTPFDFASALGSGAATAQHPAVYDVSIRMANDTPGTQRFSFALGTAEGDATTWDFGVQVFRTASADNFYTIGKRIDTTASGLASDLNIFITNTVPGTSGTEVACLMRVTDAGSETTTFNSRVQLSWDGGLTWFYDTASDPDLPNGWRLNGAGRYFIWDVAPDAGYVTYDDFSVRPVPVSATLISPPDNASGFGASVNLKAAVSNTAPGNLTVTFFGREAPKPGPGPDFCIPALPDTQNYAREAAGSGTATMEMWFAQTEWIITNRVQQNIPYVATLGDCVQNGDTLNGNPNNTEWKNSTNAMYRLESSSRSLLLEGIPYGITVGNHDQDPNGDPDGTTTLYNQYFGSSHFADKSYYGGHYSSNNDSWYDLFSAGGMDFLVISFEYGRYGDAILDWARNVMATYPTRRVIVLTHHAGDDTPDDTTVAPFSTQGQAIYTALRTNANFFLMLGGHVFNEGGEGRRSDTFQGHTIKTLISDYQGRFNGGNGLMRLMYFSPSNNLVSVKTYSPYTGNYETDANSQFSFSYNMQPNGAGSPGTPYVAQGTNANVAPGSQSSFVWTGLQANKTYEWYVKITDEYGNITFSSSSKFTTVANIAPVASNQTVTVVGDQPTELTLQASDSNGDTLTFTTNSAPLHGVLTNFDPTNGTVIYQPTTGYRGSDQFLYRANDSIATSGNATMTLTVVSPPIQPPEILTQPQNATVNQGANATFSVSATGTNLFYQWFFNSQLVNGATDSSLLISNAQPVNEGSYFVSVTNSAGTTNSSTVTLTVISEMPPVIVTQPQSTTVNQGSNVTFSVSATGLNLSYQWYFAGQPVGGGTDSTLLITNARPINVGSYYVTVANSGGPTNSSTVYLAVTPDSTRPTISVTTPGKGKGTNQSSITVTGYAKDSGAGNSGIIQSVRFALNRGVTNEAAISDMSKGTWSFISTSPIELTPGTNSLSVWASDFAGNQTNVTIPFFYDLTNTLTLHINNNGKVKMGTTNWSGATTLISNVFKVGRPYRLDAFVDKGTNCIFTNWTTEPLDFGTSTNVWVQKSSLPFVMQKNMVITANFITNPFTAAAGAYNGLFFDTMNGVSHETAGFIQVRVKDKSFYSGLLFFDGNKISFSGKFNTGGTVTREVLRTKVPGNKPAVMLSLAVDLSPDGEAITGTLSATNGEWVSQIVADKGVFNDKSLPLVLNTNYAGNYTMQIPVGPGAPGSSPGGIGYGAISNSAGGIVKLSGALGDGERLSQKMNVSREGQWPLYIGLYKNAAGELKGSLMGWIKFATNGDFGPSSDNIVTWIKKDASESTTRYPNGFTNALEIAGSPYVAPEDLANPINITSGKVVFSGGNLGIPITNLITAVTNKKVTVSPLSTDWDLSQPTITFNKRNGTFTGGFLNPSTRTPFQGVLLQNTTNASGFFLGTSQSGSVKVDGN